MVTYSNSEIHTEREMSNNRTYIQLDPKLFDAILPGSIYTINSNEFKRCLNSKIYIKNALNWKEHFSSENQFRKPNKNKGINHCFCSFWNTYRKKENCHHYSRNEN